MNLNIKSQLSTRLITSFAFLFILCFSSLHAQTNKFENANSPGCVECRRMKSNFPKEIYYYPYVRDSIIYLHTPSRKWIDTLMFRKDEFGFAIEIMTKDMFSCHSIKPYNISETIYGRVLDPIYRTELLEKIEYALDSTVIIPLGIIPEEYAGKEIELNYFLVSKGNYCYHQTFFNIDTHRWDLLEMGLYVDSLLMNESNFLSSTSQIQSFSHSKTLKFEIPFNKNESKYLPENIKALYDSLDISKYNITEIHIRAYASVEGTLERNTLLQKERANAIVDALQAYQSPQIKTHIKTMENWVEFYQDIEQTEYAYLKDLPKDEVRQTITDKKLDEPLEEYLSKHRKAIVLLEMKKKIDYSSYTEDELFENFRVSLEDKDIAEAIKIQNSIFRSIEREIIPPESLNKVEIPKELEYSLLLNRQLIFQYKNYFIAIQTAISELEELHTLIPEDDHILYNLIAVQLRLLSFDPEIIDHNKVYKEIEKLSKSSIPENLITRMKVNHDIIMCELYMKKGQYRLKDKTVMQINALYKQIKLSDAELLKMSKFFASYHNTVIAIRILEKRAKEIDADEDIIYYYLSLTIAHDKFMRDYDYRLTLQNAYNLNPDRFCSMFNSNLQGGITFQLLRNNYLRKFYCGHCE